MTAGTKINAAPWLLLLPLLLLGIILTLCKADKGAPIKAYIDLPSGPFGFVTGSERPDIQDILIRGKVVWTITSPEDKDRLRAILNTGEEGQYNDYGLRAVIIDDNDVYLIDSAGNALRSGRKAIQIDKGEFIRFKQALDSGQRAE